MTTTLTPPAKLHARPPADPRGPRLDPWNDPTLTTGQRVAAALNAALALGERLATLTPGTPQQTAYTAGWHAGWAACNHDQATAWRHLAARVRTIANQPSHTELTTRRTTPPATRQLRNTPGWPAVRQVPA